MWVKVQREQKNLERKSLRNGELVYGTTVVCFCMWVYVCECAWVCEFVSAGVYKYVYAQAQVCKGVWVYVWTSMSGVCKCM